MSISQPKSHQRSSVFLIVAGESSGDTHAAELVRYLQTYLPHFSFFGIGGNQLIAQGLDPLYHVSQMQVTGFVEVAKRYAFFKHALRRTVEEAQKRKPAFAILVDYPGFNLRLARSLHQMDIPVYYYIAPQLWAWREGRIKYLQRFVQKLIVLFPFEQQFFSDRGVTTEYYGHPLINQLDSERIERCENAKKIRGNDARIIIAYLPGSRQNEVLRHVEELKSVAYQLGSEYRHIIARANSLSQEFIEASFVGNGAFEIVDSSDGLLEAADVAVVKSGTSTLQTAMIGTPFAVIYKASPLTYGLGRILAKVKYISIVNILADTLVVPEFLQSAFKADELVKSLKVILTDKEYRSKMEHHFGVIRNHLQGKNPYQEAAQSIANSIR